MGPKVTKMGQKVAILGHFRGPKMDPLFDTLLTCTCTVFEIVIRITDVMHMCTYMYMLGGVQKRVQKVLKMGVFGHF